MFENMNPKSRLWIYQADRPFTEVKNGIRQILDDFVNQWTAHRQQLLASYEIAYDQFILFAVDEAQAQASGCSIDSSVRIIQQIESQFNISLLNRMLLTYRDGKQIKVMSRADFAQAIQSGLLSKDTEVFNNTIQTVDKLPNWESTVETSWHADAFLNR